jgi:hypothetical protein
MNFTSYFSPLLPTIITTPGCYKTRCGEVVTITSVGTSLKSFDCLGSYGDGMPETWNKTGRLHYGVESQNDIVEAIGNTTGD